MKDPVNGYDIPEEWLDRSDMPRDELVKGIESGRLVILSDGGVLRRGLSTGTTAAAAAKSAILSIGGEKILLVDVPTPVGLRADVLVDACDGVARVWKESGDHGDDVTAGIEIMAFARESDAIKIEAGAGIGLVMRDGLRVPRGERAINPTPMRQIKEAIQEAADKRGLKGVRVTLSVPEGFELAQKTLNSRVGVLGGISILGTTGFVEPWNHRMEGHVVDIVGQADRVVLTTGRAGLSHSSRMFPDYKVVMVGGNLSPALDAAGGDVVICGLPGLILKWGDPDLLIDTGFATVGEMIDKCPDHSNIDDALGKAVEKAGCRIILLNRDGSVLRDNR